MQFLRLPYSLSVMHLPLTGAVTEKKADAIFRELARTKSGS